MAVRNPQRAVVVGGSMGGLTAGLLLRELGFEVDVFERSPLPLEGRGAGIVLQPDTIRWFAEHGGTEAVERVSTGSSHLRYLGPDDEILYDEPSTWRFTSWTATYRALLAGLTRAHELGLDRVAARSDSRLLIAHVSGECHIRNPRLLALEAEITDQRMRIGTVLFEWIPAAANGEAHRLVAQALRH